jgi:hypothetical protein
METTDKRSEILLSLKGIVKEAVKQGSYFSWARHFLL